MNRARHLLTSSLIVVLFFGLGKLTGLVRLFLVADTFGTTPAYDAFTAANQLPELFFTLIAGGALAAAFIPVYSQYLTKESERDAARLANTILTLVLLILGGICLVGAALAPWIASTLLVPDFSPEQQQLTAMLMRVILIQTTLFGVSGVLSSILNAHQHFALPALAPIALDIGYIFGLLFLVPSMGIMGLAWGTVLGGILHILIQFPALFKYKITYRPSLAVHMAGVREIIRLMGPRIVTLGVIQLADLYIIRLASALPEGSTSGYFYGYAFMQFPETLLGTAVAIVVFPTLAELYNGGDIEGLKGTAVNALRLIWFLTIPAAALMLLFGRPVLGLLFAPEAVSIVFAVLLVFSVRVVSEASNEIVARLFYARHNTRTPMFAYLGWLVVNMLFAYLLVTTWGVVGLALASTIAFTFLAGLLYYLNRRELGYLGERELAATGGRALLATGGMALVILAIGLLLPLPAITTNLSGARNVLAQLLYLGVVGLFGTAVYLLLHTLLGGTEIRELVRLLRSRPMPT
jgi:putative peptidoglycan lipid II flippase